MKTLVLHAESFSYTPVAKEIRSAEDASTDAVSFSRCLVAFVAVETGDETKAELYELFSNQLATALSEVGESVLVLYPFVHLTDSPAKPPVALEVLRRLELKLRETGVRAMRAPFGWTKKFSVSIFGHPLAERSFRF